MLDHENKLNDDDDDHDDHVDDDHVEAEGKPTKTDLFQLSHVHGWGATDKYFNLNNCSKFSHFIIIVMMITNIMIIMMVMMMMLMIMPPPQV